MKEIKVVIGHRLGKGFKVAKGVEKAGGKAIVIPGVGADMKLGDVMHKENADIGISFCGGGGGGALAAGNKYGYKATYDLRSIESGITAIKKGYKVLGFSFLDVEELGSKIVEAYKKKDND
ncbi:SFCGS family glycine-rich protein [Abyssisolibacter fermentans]|uniref:SFCGS family glycine-rich protein n=1 Tax=Abyssisolibacter fermentans TaxID=1766203 RepID=UPI000832BDA6|nr:SFCGS family glycine-rich protein [Abyssisolibacter fermentans]